MNFTRRHRLPYFFERLEPRRLLSVSLDSNGWYQFTPSSDTRIVYVSSSAGLDTNDGLSPDTPVQTIAAGEALIRNNSADWLLLKRGDTFDGGFGTWRMSGRSSDEPLLIGAYGDGDRPLIDSGVLEGFFTDYGGSPVNNIALTGVHFVANTYDGTNGTFETTGIRLLRQGQNYIIQDVKVEGYKDNIVLQGDGTGITNFEINRVISIDAYNHGNAGNGHAQGLYAYELTNGLTIERSVFDHNGWNTTNAPANVFNHDLYINTGAQNVIVRNNIISRGANNGLLLRAGGTVQDNLFLSNSVGAIVDNTASIVTGNVVIGSVPVPGAAQGVGFNIETDVSGEVANNIVAHDQNSGTSGIAGISINTDAAHITVENNTVYDWRNGISNSGNRKITIRDNASQAPTDTTKPIMLNVPAANPSTYFYSNNIYYSKKSKPFQINGVDQTLSSWISATKETNAQFQQLNYVDPNRTAATYNATLGGDATLDAFLTAARNQTGAWDPNYAAGAVIQYIRAGFAAAAPTGQLRGSVYNDVDGDGLRDGADTSFGGGVTVYLDSDNDGQLETGEPTTTTDSSGNYSFINLADGAYHVRVVVPSGRQQTAPLSATSNDINIGGGATYAGRDFGITGPPLYGSLVVNLQTAQLITASFNTDVSASLDASDLQVRNVDTGTLVDSSLFTFNKSAAGSRTIATWSTISLPDGNYHVTLPKDSVSSVFGGLPADLTYDFFVLAGDGNNSRIVDILDFNILAANFGKTGQTFTQGNYDYSADGLVNITDFNVLAREFGKQVPAPPGSAASSNTTVVTDPAAATQDVSAASIQTSSTRSCPDPLEANVNDWAD